MIDFIQEGVMAIAITHSTYSASHTPIYINMENHRYATFICGTGGTASAGVKLAITKSNNASAGSTSVVAAPWVGNVYYTNTAAASKTSMVQTAHSSSTSVGYMVIPATTGTIVMGTVDAATVTDDNQPYIAITAKAGGAASSLDLMGFVYLHGNRYQNETGHDVLA